jgi:hypothetical protein
MDDSAQGRSGGDLRVEAGGLWLGVTLSVDVLNEERTQDVDEKLERTAFSGLLVVDPEHLFCKAIPKGAGMEMKGGAIEEMDG